MEGLQLTQYVYQRVDESNLEQYRPFLESIKDFATYNQQYKMIEYHFDSQQYINLKDLLLLTSQKVLFLSDQQFCEICLKILESLQYLQSQIKHHGTIKEDNIWIVTSKPLKDSPVETEFKVVYSGLFSLNAKNSKLEDDFKTIKTILQQLDSKIFPKSWLGQSQFKVMKHAQSIIELENCFKENSQLLQKQGHPKIIQSEQQIEIFMNQYSEQDFQIELGMVFGHVLRNNMLNFIVKHNKIKEFKQKITLQQLLQKLKLSDLYGFIKKMILQMQTVVIINNEQVFAEQNLICQYLKYQEIFNSLDELQKNQPKPDTYQKLLHSALLRDSEEKESLLIKIFPQSHKLLKSNFNSYIANFILYCQWENLENFVIDCNKVIKKEIQKLYKDAVDIETQLIVREGYSQLDQLNQVVPENLKKQNILQKYLHCNFTIQTLQECKELYVCTRQFVEDTVGQQVLAKIKQSYFEEYRKIHEKFIQKLII